MPLLASSSPVGIPRRILSFSARLLAVLVVAANAGAQAQPPSACYVPGSGTVYRVGQSDSSPACLSGHTPYDILALPFLRSIAFSGTLASIVNTGSGGATYFEANSVSPTAIVLNRGGGGALYVEGHGVPTEFAFFATNLGTGPAIGATSSHPNGTAIFNNANGAGLGLRVDGAMRAITNGPQPAGLFSHLTGGTALRADGPSVFNGPVTFNGNTVATGTKSAIVTTTDGVREMYTEEATEVWFTDYGLGRLVDGRAWIRLDPTFMSTIAEGTPYHVFVQSYGSVALVVARRSGGGFEVRLPDLPRGTRAAPGAGSAEFSYRLVGKRRGFEGQRLERATVSDTSTH